MKNLKLFVVALVAILGFTACDKDCGHDFIEHDFSKELVGTWTSLNGELAEAMVIKEDGSFTTTGVMKGGSLYEEKGTIKVVNNKVTLSFDGDNETFEGRLEFVAGKSLSIVMYDDNDVRLTYDYCENDLSDEVIGMWVSNDGPIDMSNEIMIRTYSEDGKVTTTGVRTIGGNPEWMLNEECNYRVIGDLVFKELSKEIAGQLKVTHSAERFVYAPKATVLGDLMNVLFYLPMGDSYVESTVSFLRVKQNLNLNNGKVYDYSAAYVSNAEGKDEDFNITGNTFNMDKVEARDFDVMFRSVLFAIELNTNSIKQNFLINGTDVEFDIPISVDGNKVTLNLSAANPAYRDVDMYMFQDQDDTQMHIYMSTSSFINYFANLEIVTMLSEGKIDPTDAAAIEKVYANMDARVESINVSLVLKARK